MREGKYIKGTFLNNVTLAIEMTCDERQLFQFITGLAANHKLIRKMMLVAATIPDEKYKELVKVASLGDKFMDIEENKEMDDILDGFLEGIEKDNRQNYEDEINDILKKGNNKENGEDKENER